MAETKTKAAGKDAETEVNSQQIDDLQAQAREKILQEIGSMTVQQFRAAFCKLYSKLANDILDGEKNKQLSKADGFLLEESDPYARAIEHVFTQAGGVAHRVVVRKLEISRIPLIIPYTDPATKAALESYIVRASGAGDTERVQRAKAALQKCK